MASQVVLSSIELVITFFGAHVSNVGSGTNATSEKVMRSIPNEVIRFFFN
jgi:hypothetical protein